MKVKSSLMTKVNPFLANCCCLICNIEKDCIPRWCACTLESGLHVGLFCPDDLVKSKNEYSHFPVDSIGVCNKKAELPKYVELKFR